MGSSWSSCCDCFNSTRTASTPRGSEHNFELLPTGDTTQAEVIERVHSKEVGSHSPQKHAQEDKIELVFRSKRTNVFAHGFDIDQAFQLRDIPKTQRQTLLISKIYAFIF